MGRLTEYFAMLNGEAGTRRRSYIGLMPRRIGPLEDAYDPEGLPFRVRLGDRCAQLIVALTKAKDTNDHTGFGENVPEFCLVYDALNAERGWGSDFIEHMWPDWRYHAKNHSKNSNTKSPSN